jgi:hypothetical protein
MKPGAIITPKTRGAKFYVRSATRNGWVRCHAIERLTNGQQFPSDHVFKFRAREMEVVG